MATNADAVLELAGKEGLLRSRDLAEAGIPRVTLTRLERAGKLERVGRGLYALPGNAATEHRALAEACKRVPRGVVCLLSALQFHGLTTQQPFEVWLAIRSKDRKPRIEYPPLRIVRFGERALVEGVEQHDIEGVSVSVTTPARTVVDCFAYRNKIGVDVAVEALRDYRRERRGSVDDLWRAAELRRVQNVMRPYLEAVG